MSCSQKITSLKHHKAWLNHVICLNPSEDSGILKDNQLELKKRNGFTDIDPFHEASINEAEYSKNQQTSVDCSICHKTYKSKDSLRTHTKKFHTPSSKDSIGKYSHGIKILTFIS